MIQQLQALVTFLPCSRRAQKPPALRGVKCMNEKRNTWKGRDIAEVSTDDFSDQSTRRVPAGSWDSDWDTDTTPPGGFFNAPPGLGAPRNHTRPRSVEANSHMNRHAAPFVPNSAQVPPLSESNILALKEALDRLAPDEIATVKLLLDSKVRDAGIVNATGPGYGSSRLQTQPSRSDMSTRRPFAPFQCSQAQHNAVKRTAHPGRPTRELPPKEETLRTFLLDLSLVDNARVLSLRKISALGIDSPNLLETYLSKFGKVERMMISHTMNRNANNAMTRLRPAALGFAVMEKAEEAQTVLATKAHKVAGVEITIAPFQSHSIDSKD